MINLPVSYYAEYQSRLSTIQLSLTLPTTTTSPVQLSLTTQEESLFAELELKISGVVLASYEVPLPSTVASTQQELEYNTPDTSKDAAATQSFKLPAPQPAQAISSSSSELHLPPLSTSELTSFQPTHFTCSSCDHTLLHFPQTPPTTSSTFQWRSLPSPHWQEIADAWLCHPNGPDGGFEKDFTTRYKEKMEKGIWPTESLGLVDLGALWVSVGAREGDIGVVVDSGLVRAMNETTESGDWKPVRCSCDRVIGSWTYSAANEGESLNGQGDKVLKLHKYALKLYSSQTESSLCYTISDLILSEMLDSLEALSTHRFQLYSEAQENEGEETERGLFWVFQPDLKITCGTVGGETSGGRVAKVLYKLKDDQDSSKPVPPNLSGSGQIGRLTYPEPAVNEFMEELEASTSKLPLSMRTMGGFKVGLLLRR